MSTESKTARTGWLIPKELDARIDQKWAERRVAGIRQTKQDFVALVLDLGLAGLEAESLQVEADAEQYPEG